MDAMELLGARDVAKLLNVTPGTVHRFVATGQLKPVAVVGAKRVQVFAAADIEQFAQHYKGAASA